MIFFIYFGLKNYSKVCKKKYTFTFYFTYFFRFNTISPFPVNNQLIFILYKTWIQ
jgi:hypothetical protein